MFLEIASAVLGAVSLFSSSSTNKKMNDLTEKEKKIELKGTILELGANIKDTEDVIGVYGDFLSYAKSKSMFGDMDELQGVQADTDVDIRAKEIYNRVYEGLGLANVAAGATGRMGGSVGLYASDVTEGVLQDIKTGASQLDVYKTSLDLLKESKTEYIDMYRELEIGDGFSSDEAVEKAKNSTLYKNDAEYRAIVDKAAKEYEEKKAREKESDKDGRDREEKDRGYGWGDDWSGHEDEGGKYDRDTWR